MIQCHQIRSYFYVSDDNSCMPIFLLLFFLFIINLISFFNYFFAWDGTLFPSFFMSQFLELNLFGSLLEMGDFFSTTLLNIDSDC